ncbi:MAG TPA: serine/threonine-protein kinase, partial [Kofleriaceae bacterium]|nr:serine/threonine-protein kinase [Kofleriaceae bacterium]
ALVRRPALAAEPRRVDRAAADRSPPRDVTLGKYQLVRHLASGGTSHVFLARIEGPTGFSRHLVIKTLRQEHAHNPAHVAAFVDEAWFLSSLHHGNIVQISDVGTGDDGTHYLAMDYLHGETLRAVLQQVRASGERLPLDFALTAVASCAEALQYVHTRHGSDGRWLRMVHRDVTPSNLMACYDGAIKLIDFGNAKAATRTSHTPTGEIKGETEYMAPEQARGDAVDLRSDVFSLGVVLYELTTRIHPFADRSDKATKQRLLHGEITPPAQLLADYPSELSRVVMTALARDPNLRYRDCGALGRAIQELAERLELRTGPAAVRQAMVQLFGAKQEAWEASPSAKGEAAAATADPRDARPRARGAESSEPVSRRNKPTRPLQPQSPDRASAAASGVVAQSQAVSPSSGLSAARAAALPPAPAMVAPSAKSVPLPPLRLPAASNIGAVAQPARPDRALDRSLDRSIDRSGDRSVDRAAATSAA